MMTMVRLIFPLRFNLKFFLGGTVFPGACLDLCSVAKFWGAFQLCQLLSTLDIAHSHGNV